jgi:hypothetical protein
VFFRKVAKFGGQIYIFVKMDAIVSVFPPNFGKRNRKPCEKWLSLQNGLPEKPRCGILLPEI